MDDQGASASRGEPRGLEAMTPLAVRVRAEYLEMPGLQLTIRQAARLFGISTDVAAAVLDELSRASILACPDAETYSLVTDLSRSRTLAVIRAQTTRKGRMPGSLREVSVDRLACLLRHWTWTDEALARFDRELADGWDYGDDPMADHPFGAYYHWCALLCAFGEAAIDDGLLPPSQLEPIRQDIEAALPGLRACRQLLVAIPSSLEQQPRIVDLMRDGETLPRLRRVHEAFGAALRDERMLREIDSLNVEAG